MAVDERGRRISGLVFAAVTGALSGAALAGRRGRRAAVLGGLAGAAALAGTEAVSRARQRPGEVPAWWSRVVMGGALGLRAQKVGLGPVVGGAVGAVGRRVGGRDASSAAVAASAVVGYRAVAALLFRDPQVGLLAERARAEDLPFVVPLEARGGY